MRDKKALSITTACCLMLTTLPDYQSSSIDNPFTIGPKRPPQVMVKKATPHKLQNKRRTLSSKDTDIAEKEMLYRMSFQRSKQHAQVLKAAQEQTRRAKLAMINQPQTTHSMESQTALKQQASNPPLSSRSIGLLDTNYSTNSNTNMITYTNTNTNTNTNSSPKIVSQAMRFLGAPYRWSGNTPDGFDCSGFVQYVFRLVGIQLPRTSFDQYRTGVSIASANLQPGDLVFFSTYASGASHVGIYVGKGSFIQCLNSNTGVVLSRIDDPYYRERFVGAKRIPIST